MKQLLQKIKASRWAEYARLAVDLVAGAYLTSLALDQELWKRPTLHIFIFLSALCFDVCFCRLAHRMLRRKAIPAFKSAARRAFSSVFRRIARIADRLIVRRDGKVFLEGKQERRFAVETRVAKQVRHRKKLPRLSADADERAKARHAYTVFVFKKDKDIPSVLTPTEVAARLDANGENAEIFQNYNVARYSEENP